FFYNDVLRMRVFVSKFLLLMPYGIGWRSMEAIAGCLCFFTFLISYFHFFIMAGCPISRAVIFFIKKFYLPRSIPFKYIGMPDLAGSIIILNAVYGMIGVIKNLHGQLIFIIRFHQ